MEQTFRLNSDTSEMTITRNFRPERSPDAGLDQTLQNSSDEYQMHKTLPNLPHLQKSTES
jgi:hypothetical protein